MASGVRVSIKLRAPIANGAKQSQAVAQQMAQAVVADMIAGIRAGRQIDNTPLKANAASTRVKKMAAGRKPLSLIDCEALKVAGAFRFGEGVRCKGAVEFKNETNAAQEVPAGEYTGKVNLARD